jgi:hypothetical protein
VPSRAAQSKPAVSPHSKRTEYDMLTHRRSAARIVLLPTDCLADETAAFDLLMNGVYVGHWAETNTGCAAVTWVGGVLIETEPFDGDGAKILAAIRPTIPASFLGLEEESTPPKYNVAIVESVLLEVAAELHPEHPSTDGLLGQIVADPEDRREVETGKQAIRNLREFGLFSDRDGEIVMPTPAALHAVALLT